MERLIIKDRAWLISDVAGDFTVSMDDWSIVWSWSLLVCMRFWSQPGPRYVAESLVFINLGAYQALILLRFYSLLVESPGRL